MRTKNTPSTKSKTGKKPVAPKYKKKIEKLDTLSWLVFDALRDGPLKGTKEEADLFEVITAKGIRKHAMKLVKKGLANVKDGVFTISKYGKQQIL